MDQSTLKQVFLYDPKSGEFRWKIDQRPRGKAGALAGYMTHGYVKISYRGKKHYAHRLAFLYMTGEVPKEIDHINQCRSDNRWSNLRASNRRQNLANVKGRGGVSYRYGKWYARYGRAGHIGVFDTEADARAAYLSVATKAAGKHPDETSGQKPRRQTKRKHERRLYNGQTLNTVAKQHGISQQQLYYRVQTLKWPLEKALQHYMTTG
jgi:hypothetical protein